MGSTALPDPGAQLYTQVREGQYCPQCCRPGKSGLQSTLSAERPSPLTSKKRQSAVGRPGSRQRSTAEHRSSGGHAWSGSVQPGHTWLGGGAGAHMALPCLPVSPSQPLPDFMDCFQPIRQLTHLRIRSGPLKPIEATHQRTLARHSASHYYTHSTRRQKQGIPAHQSRLAGPCVAAGQSRAAQACRSSTQGHL